MSCPMYVNSFRTCKKQLPFKIPNWVNTFKYCITGEYAKCPLFIGIKKIGNFCEYFLNCQECKGCKIHESEGFDEAIKKYCFSKDNTNCCRYKIKKTGKKVPVNLCPDGSLLLKT